MAFELANKVAIITGGAAGIGAAAARHFVREGAQVVIADVKADQGEALEAELGPDCAFKYTDVLRRSDLDELVAFAVETFGGLDIMFNNAGISGRTQPSLPEVDLLGVTLGTEIAARHMREHGGGSIINTTSIDGVHFSRSAAINLAEYGIRVNCITPGAYFINAAIYLGSDRSRPVTGVALPVELVHAVAS
jgi:NAD(P)-dependent dehydrogenase (short-subunit alcohol dehydrogenase family)